jgi:hypothetical protein
MSIANIKQNARTRLVVPVADFHIHERRRLDWGNTTHKRIALVGIVVSRTPNPPVITTNIFGLYHSTFNVGVYVPLSFFQNPLTPTFANNKRAIPHNDIVSIKLYNTILPNAPTTFVEIPVNVNGFLNIDKQRDICHSVLIVVIRARVVNKWLFVHLFSPV